MDGTIDTVITPLAITTTPLDPQQEFINNYNSFGIATYNLPVFQTTGLAGAVSNTVDDPTKLSTLLSGQISSQINVASGFISTGADPNTGGMAAATISTDTVFWTGTSYSSRASALFRVDAAGNVVANSVSTRVRFGGTGADGALAIGSGTTTLSFAGASTLVKNYTSITIGTTGALGFSNPNANGSTAILKSQGDVTITSTTVPAIDLRSMGAAAGTGGPIAGAGSAGQGGAGGNSCNTQGASGQGGNGVGAGSVGTAGNDGRGLFTAGGGPAGTSSSTATVAASSTFTAYNPSSFGTSGKVIVIMPGGGGGGSSGGSNSAGATGGIGGGSLYIECGGKLNITSTLNTSGAAGSNGGNSAGGGGGGGGGCIVIVYNMLTANTGTYTVAGGAKGIAGASAGDGGKGGDSYSLIALNTEFS